MKLLFIVMDGAFDRKGTITSLASAHKPNIDRLAERSRLGTMYPIGEGIAPESDSAVISILGYNPEEGYSGRGPLEALGVGLVLKTGHEVAFRANFASVDPKDMRILDRRAGRSVTDEEAGYLASCVDNMKLDVHGSYARVIPTVGYRAVVVLGSVTERLSDNVENTDPAYKRVGRISEALRQFDMRVKRSVPLDGTPEARITAEVVNSFMARSIDRLDRAEVNVRRERNGLPKANCLLMRDPGASPPRFEPIQTRFGRTFGATAEMPVERGIARALKMDLVEVAMAQDIAVRYGNMLTACCKLLGMVDVVYAHIKGPDEPGHEGDLHGKVSSIESIDRYFIGPLLSKIDVSLTSILVTSDHATPWDERGHSGDPVGVLFFLPGVKGDGYKRFAEDECARGSLGIIRHGWELLPKIFSMISAQTKSR